MRQREFEKGLLIVLLAALALVALLNIFQIVVR